MKIVTSNDKREKEDAIGNLVFVHCSSKCFVMLCSQTVCMINCSFVITDLMGSLYDIHNSQLYS